MEQERKKIFTSRIVALIFILIAIGIGLYLEFAVYTDEWYSSMLTVIWTSVGLFNAIILVFAFILVKCKLYKYEDIEVVVYSGISKRYLKINDEILDEHRGMLGFTDVKLSAMASIIVDVTINPTTNSISCKINGKVVYPQK